VQAGIIGEIGCSWPLHKDERKVLLAAALASKETGAAICVHPGRDETAPAKVSAAPLLLPLLLPLLTPPL